MYLFKVGSHKLIYEFDVPIHIDFKKFCISSQYGTVINIRIEDLGSNSSSAINVHPVTLALSHTLSLTYLKGML